MICGNTSRTLETTRAILSYAHHCPLALCLISGTDPSNDNRYLTGTTGSNALRVYRSRGIRILYHARGNNFNANRGAILDLLRDQIRFVLGPSVRLATSALDSLTS